ncbi:MAG: ABC transporter ATP-binding protein [Fretibacterium sp.]|nr:ABC transporter ATP-binding protein [Fretibacterium sp.]
MAQLILKNVYKRYENKKKSAQDYAVKDFSLHCEHGEFIGILGPSGCGKTTTLRMIAGLEEITDGAIFIGDRKVNDLHPKDRGIGLAFEDYALYPPLNVYENIAFNLRAQNLPADEIDRRVREIAPLMKVETLLDMKPAGLSGGQKQRVNIARALVRRPQVLLLDEPLSHLDGKMRQVLRTEIKRIHNKIKCTTVLVTHDQMEAMSLADRIAIMKDGQLQQFGTPLEVYDNPVNLFVAGFIGEPPMNLMKVTISGEGERFYFEFPRQGIRVRVPKKYSPVVREGMEVILGVRPTDIFITEPSEDSEVSVDVFENLGDEKRVSIDVGEEDFLTLTTEDERRYTKGERIGLIFHEEKTHIFDPVTEERILGVQK